MKKSHFEKLNVFKKPPFGSPFLKLLKRQISFLISVVMNYLFHGYKYDIISTIGEGGYGIIYKARDVKTKNIVTIKQIKRKVLLSDEKIPKVILQEAQILKEFKGSNKIINLKDIYMGETGKNVYFVYDYYEYDVRNLICQKNPLTYQQVKSYMKQMISALLTVHSKNYIHGDVKPENFLISSGNQIKLIDFGLTKHINQKNKGTAGTYNYSAPELVSGNSDYGIEVDVWSLGCTFYELMTQKKLISNCCSDSDVADQIVEIFGYPTKEDFPQFFTYPKQNLFLDCLRQSKTSVDEFFEEKLPNEFKPMKHLLIQMLQLNPNKRISLLDALNDPVLSDAEPPENLPLITLAETIFKKEENEKCSLDKNKRKDLYEKLRPEKIVPPSII